jgi:hypothetical protein
MNTPRLIGFTRTIWTLVMLSGFFIALLSGRKYFIISVMVSLDFRDDFFWCRLERALRVSTPPESGNGDQHR